MTTRLVAAAMLCALSLVGAPSTLSAAAADDDRGIRLLLNKLEQAAQDGRVASFQALLTETVEPRRAEAFYENELTRGATRVVIQERERVAVPDVPAGEAYRIVVDALMEYGARGRVATWQFDIKNVESQWRIDDEGAISSVENIYRLGVNPATEYAAHDLVISSEDLTLTLPEGSVFTIDTDNGMTGLVLLGRGQMRFSPRSDTEKGQVRIFCGSTAIDSAFDAVYIRLGDPDLHFDRSKLVERAVDQKDLKRAEALFRDESTKTFALDLADLTRDTWSLPLDPKDFVAEVRTRRYDTLTYVNSSSEPEDIAVFDRRRQRNISVYSSAAKLAAQGPFYNEDRLAAYDVVDYNIEATLSPDRLWLNGQTTMRLKILARNTGVLTIRLADTLVVQSIVSNRYGRLFGVRARGQNAVIVSLPGLVTVGGELTLTISYYGRLQPDEVDREAVRLEPQDQGDNPPYDPGMSPLLRPEPTFLYSSHSYWYPQAPTSDYATARIQITVPNTFECVASGEPGANSPLVIEPSGALPGVKVFTFTASRPVRYLAFLVTRLQQIDQKTLTFPDGGTGGRSMILSVEANPRRTKEAGSAGSLGDVAAFYQSIIGDSPYPGLTLALVEGRVPSGHSPAYFAMLMKPPPGTPETWRDDPAEFEGVGSFILAHETAHQWWGQAVGWANYHEQWLSEGFAQYFAALYAQHQGGDEAFGPVMRQMRKWALDKSDQGPVYLGYRLGHIKQDGRVFRALVYNKSAVVLHMLRRLLGDEVFFRGIRRFYTASKFTKAGTDDFRRAMETESGQPLARFFDRWIYGSTLPRVTFTYRVEPAPAGQTLVLHFEQAGDDIFDLPVTVRVQYSDKRTVDIVVPVTERSVEKRVPLEGTLRNVEVSKDDGTLADVRTGSSPH